MRTVWSPAFTWTVEGVFPAKAPSISMSAPSTDEVSTNSALAEVLATAVTCAGPGGGTGGVNTVSLLTYAVNSVPEGNIALSKLLSACFYLRLSLSRKNGP